MKECKSVRKGGGFGIKSSFYGGIEQQEKGTLHFHAVIYLPAFTSTCNKFELSYS